MTSAGRVRVLPDDLANQIAAGEVVERPASVVKELVENAVDAGARRIRVEVESGGVALVRVTDDGSGMARADAELATLRHATSKIRSLEDLLAIESFGFRGEALPSIASVSRFTLRTRTAGDDEGTQIVIEGGGPMAVLPCGSAVGTSIEVRDLFFNVPARRKFLRALGTESAHVTDVVESAALSAPGISFTLVRDGRVVREWLRASDREERVRAVHDGEPLVACRGQRGPLVVEAFLSRPERARSGALGLSMFVNGRPVRDRALARAVAHAYGSVLEPGRYPVGVVFLDLPIGSIDVNVHPQKAEVRFAEGRAVADALAKIIGTDLSRAFGIAPARFSGFAKAPPAPTTSTAAGWSFSGSDALMPSPSPDPWGLGPTIEALPVVSDPRVAEAQALPLAGGIALAVSPGVATDVSLAAEPIVTDGARTVAFGRLRFLAQSRRTFLLCEGDDGLYVLDQHAAAERVTFDKLRTAFRARKVATQALLFPIVVAVSASEVALVEEAHEDALAAGLDLRPAGTAEIAVHAVPKILGRASPERLARDLVAELARAGGRAYSGALDLALATMACHGSVRAGDEVSAAEAQSLLAQLDEVDFAGHCPHGRPVVMRLGWSELEHRVGRR